MKKDTDNAYGLFRFASHATIALAYILMFAQAAYANEATPALTVSLNIRDGATLVWSGTVPLSASTTETVSVTPTGSSDAISVLRNSVLGALITADAAQTEFDISDIAYYSSFDSFLINCIAIPAVSASARCYNWQYVVSGTYPSVGIDDYALSGGETIYLYFGTPRRVILSAAETVPTIPVTATAQSYDYTNDSWTTLSGAVVGATQPNPDNPWSPLEIMTGTSGVNGLVDLTLPAIGSYNVGLQSDYYGTTTPLLVRTLADNEVIVRIRNGVEIGFQGIGRIGTGTTTLSDSTGNPHDVSAKSALAALANTDASSGAFSVSGLDYYDSFGAFYIRCITLASQSCDNWQYVVSGTYPSVGIDDYALSGGETIYLYFGTPRRVILSAAETVPTIPVTATAQSYDYTNDSWTTLSGAVVGATQPNPDNPWSPLEIMTGTSGVNGLVDLTLPAIGSYNVGLQSDYYGTTTPLLVRTLADNEVIVRIRNGVEIGFQGIGRIGTGTTTLSDSTGNPHDVSAKSALAALANTDASSGAFSVSGLDYYDSFGAFYIRCITLASQSCDNWQYAVHGAIPGVGADSYELSSADELYFFFGTPRRVSISAPEITVGESVVATAEQYAPSTNAYAPALGYTIGVTQTNPDDLWSPLIIATSSVDTLGHATFGALAAGEYILGIAEDFYFPGTTLTVRAVVAP
ncbi:MAG: hypothetical protein AAB819_03340, partial [Patescibacteria group bacterium]